jgi:hypothetical protein
VLYPSIPYTNTDPSYAVWCEIYRSTSEDGEYELVSNTKVNCLSGIGLTDEDLSMNTTYWYKTKVDYGTIYSDPIKVTTKAKVENPKTGVKSYIIPTVLLITIIGSSLYIISRKTLFKL